MTTHRHRRRPAEAAALAGVLALLLACPHAAHARVLAFRDAVTPDVATGAHFGFAVGVTPDAVFGGAPFETSSGDGVVLDGTGTQLGGQGGQFGFAIATVGSLIVVGTPDAAGGGEVRVFDSATLNLKGWIANPTGKEGDRFGSAVAGSDVRFVVGAPGCDVGGAEDAGAAYVFDGDPASATFLGLERALQKAVPRPFDQLGAAVAADASRVVVGAPFDSDVVENAGAAYLFDAASGTLMQTFPKPAPNPGDLFGSAVVMSGSAVAIGAPFDDTAYTDAGAVYVYKGADGGSFVPDPVVLPNPAPAFPDRRPDYFGVPLAFFDTDLVVGASLADGAGADAGELWVFDDPVAFPNPTVRMVTSPSPAPGGRFGFSLATLGFRAVVGAPRERDGSGNVYRYGCDCCTPGATCNDNNPCTTEACNFTSGACETIATVDCNDGNACTTESCNSGTGVCETTSTVVCDDGNVCTTEVCNSSTGACETAGTTTCDDGNACETEACNATTGSCDTTNTIVCNDNNVCTTESCNTSTGACETTATVDCGSCTIAVCNPATGQCEPGGMCDDGNPCTTETCNESTGHCETTGTFFCDDGNGCTTEACDVSAGQCETTGTVDCSDGDPCTTDICMDFGGGPFCENISCFPFCPPSCQAAGCGDGRIDPPETCDPPGSLTASGAICRADCTYCGDGNVDVFDGEECDDANGTCGDGCDPNCRISGCGNGYRCTASGELCDDGNLTSRDGCDADCRPSSCLHDSECDDHDPCDGVETCHVCEGCDYIPWPCCRGRLSECVAGKAADGEGHACDDNDMCTTPDACHDGRCVGGPIIDCNDNDVCTDDACNVVTGCTHTYQPGCRPCTTVADCPGGGDPCHTAACEKGSCTTRPAPDGVSCSDGNPCNGEEGCVRGTCVRGPAPSCDDHDPCTRDTCDPVTGCLNASPDAYGEAACRLSTSVDGAPCPDAAAKLRARMDAAAHLIESAGSARGRRPHVLLSSARVFLRQAIDSTRRKASHGKVPQPCASALIGAAQGAIADSKTLPQRH